MKHCQNNNMNSEPLMTKIKTGILKWYALYYMAMNPSSITNNGANDINLYYRNYKQLSFQYYA